MKFNTDKDYDRAVQIIEDLAERYFDQAPDTVVNGKAGKLLSVNEFADYAITHIAPKDRELMLWWLIGIEWERKAREIVKAEAGTRVDRW